MRLAIDVQDAINRVDAAEFEYKNAARFLTAHPERFPETPLGECESAFLHSDRYMYDDAWFRPDFIVSFDGIPRHWLAFANSARRDLRFHFYESIQGLRAYPKIPAHL